MLKYVKVLKIFTLFALTCTVILWIALWGSSAVSGAKSGQTTDKVTGIVDNVLGVTDKINDSLETQHIAICCDKKDYYYNGETVQLSIDYSPADTKDREVNYVVSDDSVARISEDGLLEFVGTGSVSVWATLKSNPNVYFGLEFLCFGISPFTDGEFTADVKLVAPRFKVGESTILKINNRATSVRSASVTVEDPEIVSYYNGRVYGIAQGTTNLILTFKNPSGADSEIVTVPVTVKGGEITVPKLKFKDNVVIYQGDIFSKYSLLDIPDDADLKGYDCIIKTSNGGIISTAGTENLRAVGYGEVTLTYTSAYNPKQKKKITVTVCKKPPTELTIIGDNVIIPNSTYVYRASSKPIDYGNEVTWSIVSGDATITQKGVLIANKYGKVVIRCTSTVDSSIYVDKELDVKLYASAYMFVRKFMGHAGLSALLGFGIIGSLFLLSKRKWRISFSAPLAFVYAGVSELIQKYTPNRYCTMNDVLVDFIGALCGMAVAIVLVSVTCVIWRLISKKSFDKLKSAYKLQNMKTIFKSSKMICNKNFPIEPND